ncbi:MAG TPA: DoxX family protein [Vicinamibacterales bacterium]|nr:DoxX family protein [Vicinamibacterales bacterium]
MPNTVPGRLHDVVYAAMRLVAGGLFACDGVQKLFGVLGAHGRAPTPLLLAAGAIELGGGAMIAAGLAARYAAFVASGEMAVAYFMAHAPRSFWPAVNKGELAVLYCFVFLYIASRGSGILSADGAIRRLSARLQ